MANDNLILTPKPLKGEDGHRTFSIRIKSETIARIDALATQTNRSWKQNLFMTGLLWFSRNELIGILLDYALDRCVVDGEG